jgi:hypothetical protein
MSDFTGTVAAILAAEEILDTDLDTWHDAILASADAWTDYSSSLAWTATTTNPVLNNGSIAARYKQVGKTVEYAFAITMGSSTTYGSGPWLISMPVAPLNTNLVTGEAFLLHTTAASRVPAVATMSGTNQLIFYGPTGGQVAAAVPFTWTSGMALRGHVRYEVA